MEYILQRKPILDDNGSADSDENDCSQRFTLENTNDHQRKFNSDKNIRLDVRNKKIQNSEKLGDGFSLNKKALAKSPTKIDAQEYNDSDISDTPDENEFDLFELAASTENFKKIQSACNFNSDLKLEKNSSILSKCNSNQYTTKTEGLPTTTSKYNDDFDFFKGTKISIVYILVEI